MIGEEAALLGRDEIIDRITTSVDKKRIFISPILSSSQVQPSSFDVRLGAEFLIVKTGKITHLEPIKDSIEVRNEVEKYTDKYKILNKHERFILHPNEFILACTLEYIRLPADIAARIEGRSSWGRLGILVHSTAGYIDPGFCGNITFELKNVGKVPIPLYPGIRMAQLSFFRVNNETLYRGKYNESFGVVPSKYFNDFEYGKIRDSFTGKKTEDFIVGIIEAVKKQKGIPKTFSEDRLPQKTVDAIYEAYDRSRDISGDQ
jgi:dCTP deaminase